MSPLPNSTESLFASVPEPLSYHWLFFEIVMDYDPRADMRFGRRQLPLPSSFNCDRTMHSLVFCICLQQRMNAGSRATLGPWSFVLACFAAGLVIGTIASLWPALNTAILQSIGRGRLTTTLLYALGSHPIRHVYAIGVGMLHTSRSGGIMFAVTAVVLIVTTRPRWATPGGRFSVLSVALLLGELSGTAISGRAYEHYFLMWLLPIAMLTGLLLRRLCGIRIVTSDAACSYIRMRNAGRPYSL